MTNSTPCTITQNACWLICLPICPGCRKDQVIVSRHEILTTEKPTSRRHSHSVKSMESHDRDLLWSITQALLICDGAFEVEAPKCNRSLHHLWRTDQGLFPVMTFSELVSLWSGYNGPDLGCKWFTTRDKSVQYNELCLTWITHPFCSALLSCSAKTLSFSIICVSKLTN